MDEGFADLDEVLADGPGMPSDTDDITVAPLSDAKSEDEDEVGIECACILHSLCIVLL